MCRKKRRRRILNRLPMFKRRFRKLSFIGNRSSTQTIEQLLESGWSVLIRTGISDLTVSGAGVCLVSNAEARKAILELKSEKALEILVPANINNVGEERVMVDGAGGRWQVRLRFLFHFGGIPVTYIEDKPKTRIQAGQCQGRFEHQQSCTDANI